MKELKPCPFCGGKARIVWCDGAGYRKVYSTIPNPVCYGIELKHRMIECKKCGIKTKAYLTDKGAFNAWNRRVNNG